MAEETETHIGDLRALVGGMLGDSQIATLDDSTLRALSSVMLERMQFGQRAGLSFHGKRNLYEILGYPELLTYREYRQRYRRGGLAKRVVDVYPNAVWREGAEVYEDEDATTDTEFEKAWKDLEAQFGVWNRLQRVHKLALLSTYSVLLIGASGKMDEELPRGKPGSLLYLRPLSGGGGPAASGMQMSLDMRINSQMATCTVAKLELNSESPRYGMPLMYQMKQVAVSSDNTSRLIHWTRVIHAADDLLDDEIFGTPGLEAVWNLLDDLDKVEGGGSEAFFRRAAPGLHVDIDKTMGMPAGKDGKISSIGITREQKKALEDKAEEMQHQIQPTMVTRGATVTQLSSSVADFKGPVDAILSLIAGTKAIPKRILVGSEMGQLASGQDRDNWNTSVQDKRTSWAFPSLVKPFIDRLVAYGYLPKPAEVHVDWPTIEDLTTDEKVKLQIDMADVNSKQQAVVYTEAEIREVTGREPLSEEDESFGLSEMQKAEIAAKLALTNKEMGITVFTDDEIRRICYDFDPLSDAEKVPIGAPEKISVTAPPKIGEDGLPLPQVLVAQPPHVMQATLAALEAAIEDDDLDAIGEILAMGGPGSGPHKAGDIVRFNGKSVDGGTEGTMDVKVINPHSNSDKVTSTKTEGKRTRQYEGASTHIPTATVEMDRSKRGLEPLRFEAYHHTLSTIK